MHLVYGDRELGTVNVDDLGVHPGEDVGLVVRDDPAEDGVDREAWDLRAIKMNQSLDGDHGLRRCRTQIRNRAFWEAAHILNLHGLDGAGLILKKIERT